MELAAQLTPPNGPYSKSQLARALGFARASYYWKSSQARKDKAVAVAIEQLYEQDDTASASQTRSALAPGQKPGQTGDAQVRDHGPAQAQTLCLSGQSGDDCPQPGANPGGDGGDGNSLFRHL